jgi:phage-related protein
MTNGSVRAHRFALMCAAVVVVFLGWAPLQAFALDVPIDPTPVTTAVAPVVTTVTNTVSNTVPDPVDTVSNTVSTTAPNPVETVTNTISGATDPVSNTVSGAVGSVSSTVSGTAGTVSNTVSGATSSTSGAAGISNTVDGTTATGMPGAGQATTSGTPQAGQLSAMAGWSPLLPSGAYDVSPIGDEGHAACVAGVGTACESLEGTGGSWTRSVADIIRKLLAFTGMSALALFALACCLTLAGAFVLYRSRDRSELGSA